MQPAWSYEGIANSLSDAFNGRYPREPARLVGLLFAPPSSHIGGTEIVRSLEYFHHRSGNRIDFFCGGYRRFGEEQNIVIEKEVTSDINPWYYNVLEFERLRQETQQRSTWVYSGEADLILLNARKGGPGQDATLDWSSAVCCDLEMMKKDKAIESVRRFFEDIFRFADAPAGEDPAWAFSDMMGASKARSGLLRFILSILPKQLRELYLEAQHLAVRDISPKQSLYQLKELLRDGDFILAVEHLSRFPGGKKFSALLTDDPRGQLERLLKLSGIVRERSLAENARYINAKPVIAMKAALVSAYAAQSIAEDASEQELVLNQLRRDILFVLCGIGPDLDEVAVKRCQRDSEKIVHCLLAALSDVASCSPAASKAQATEVYSKLCRIISS